MKLQKTQLAAAVGVALLAVGGTAFGQAAPNVQVYGQVSRTMIYADDGFQSKWFNTDNDASGTRIGITGGAAVNPGLRAGFRLEWDFQSNESNRATFGTLGPSVDNPAHTAGTGFAERHADAWLEGAWGRVNLGQGDGASNGASESDLSGTGMANGIGVADVGGGFAFRTPAGGTSGVNVNQVINQQDFESRYDRLMYTTPTFSGFRVQASYGSKSGGTVGTVTTGAAAGGALDVKELSAWYGAKMGGLGEIAAAVGYSVKDAAGAGLTKDEYMGGSISWLHGSGLNVTYVYTTRDNPTTVAGATVRDSQFNYLKVGYKFGVHAIGVDYAQGDDFNAVGDEAKMYGIGYVWNPIRWLEIYAAYKVHQLDRTAANGGSMEDIKIGHIGTRIRF